MTRRIILFIAVLAALVTAGPSPLRADVCAQWSETERVGMLGGGDLREASGLEVSQAFEDRLYHINDSGGGNCFFTSSRNGGDMRKVEVGGVRFGDTEALGLGPFLGRSCLFVGDIGDNHRRKKHIRIIVIAEEENFGPRVEPLKVVTALYPGGSRDAEGMAVHPNGDLYIITKEFKGLRARAAGLYRLSRERLESGSGETVELTPAGELDFPFVLKGYPVWAKIVTGFDISPDGRRLLFLTYGAAVEVAHDLSEDPVVDFRQMQMKRNIDYRVIQLFMMKQQEAVAYMADGMGLLYDTEAWIFRAPLRCLRCKDRPDS
ncbi:hypothetical protein ACFL4G_08190 [Thermodesulfobacteriota bacterium]